MLATHYTGISEVVAENGGIHRSPLIGIRGSAAGAEPSAPIEVPVFVGLEIWAGKR
jgi:hypothetical protein